MFSKGGAREFTRTLRRSVFEWMGSDRYSRLALNGLDQKLRAYIDFRDGFFIEAGANDGLTQSNTYWFERFLGWRGLLIEAVPDKAIACRRNRPRAATVQSALVGSKDVRSVQINTAELMAFIPGGFNEEEEKQHLSTAMAAQELTHVGQIEVPAHTLSEILDENGSPHVDLFSLDVEGFEVEVLKGLELCRHRPALILVETGKIEAVLAVLGGNYEVLDRLTHHDYLLRSKKL
jgi:FkbM family methyltransferase